MNKLLTIQEAANWATRYLDREINPTNISYLVQYGKVNKFSENGITKVSIPDLENYYQTRNGKRELDWKQKLGDDLNWALSFDHLREKDTTKHIHRLHPYKGKYIPQLVEYFLDEHTDNYKKEIYFKKGDIVLDPFLGSGTTIVQANELGINAVGIDVSRFNCVISECKMETYNIPYVRERIETILKKIATFETDHDIINFENELIIKLNQFNYKYFPTPGFKHDFYNQKISKDYPQSKSLEFLKTYNNLIDQYRIELNHRSSQSFLDKWYIKNIRNEMQFVFDLIKDEPDLKTKKLLAIILSRTIRSCRATTHSDLATLKDAQVTTYYCQKHYKICKPIFSIKSMFNKYALDTLSRISEFNNLRSDALFDIITGDSRTADIEKHIASKNKQLLKIYKNAKIKGIFTSPPYVGQIDYHEQHAYAYDLFGFERNDNLEIGPLYKGQGLAAKESYAQGIIDVLKNALKYMTDNPEIFLVANDKYNLYPKIAEQSGLVIVDQFKRPVLNRTERDKNPYSEIIFRLKRKV